MVKTITTLLALLLLTAAAIACDTAQPPATDPAAPPESPRSQAETQTALPPVETPGATPQKTPASAGNGHQQTLPTTVPTGTPQPTADPRPTSAPKPQPVSHITLAYAETRADRPLPSLAFPAGTPVRLQPYTVSTGGVHTPITPDEVTWTTTEPGRFLIDENATIYAGHHTTGQLTIIHERWSQTFTVTAEGPPYRTKDHIKHLIIQPENIVITGLTGTAELTITALYKDGTEGPLPQDITTSPVIAAEPLGVVQIDRHSRAVPISLGVADLHATLGDKTTGEPARVHVIPVATAQPPDTSCVIPYPLPDSPSVFANAYALRLYPAYNTQENAEILAEIQGGVHAQYIQSKNTHIVHFKCPKVPEHLLTDTIEDKLSDLYHLTEVAYAEPLPAEETANPTTSPATPEPTQTPTFEPANRPGDNIISIQSFPRSARLTPGQTAHLEHIAVLYQDGATRQLSPGNPEISYTLQLLHHDDGATGPKETRQMLLNAQAQFTPLPSATTVSYTLVARYLGHRTRTRIDVRGTPAPARHDANQCRPSNGHRALIMIEAQPAHRKDLFNNLALALGGASVSDHPSFNAHVISVPCSSEHHAPTAIDTAMEFPEVITAYVHVPTQGDEGKTIDDLLVPPGQESITLRRGQTTVLEITRATFTDGTTGPIPPADLPGITISSQNPQTATVNPRTSTITALNPGHTTVFILYNGKIATTVPLTVTQ